MFRTICVPLDGSIHARRAAEIGLELAASLDARLTAIHVEAGAASQARRARLSVARSSGQGEQPAAPAALPDALTWLLGEAPRRKVAVDVKVVGGRPFDALRSEIAAGAYDLVVLGALGDGALAAEEGRQVGSTCERLVRHLRTDLLIVKSLEASGSGAAAALGGDGGILACLDGSPQSYAGLEAAVDFSKRSGRALEATAVYDPYLHYTLFNGIVGVLSEKASKVFKFKDQEKLHEEIIDTGLAKIYQAHLEVGRHVASEMGVDLAITLLDGKAHQKVLKHASRTLPSLVVMGRIGVHSTDDMDVGATTENLLRMLPVNLLITSRKHVPPIDVRAEESVQWVPEALAKMERIPSFVRGVARTAIIRWAIERGHSIITPSLINSCMGDILPKSAAQAMGWVAEETAKDEMPAPGSKSFVCSECGHASKDYRPQACPVCKSGTESFQEISRDVIASLGELERGAVEVEETFDGRSLKWTAEAKDVLRRVPNGYERRRAKARIEKTAKVRGLEGIDEAFALDMVQQDMADTSYLSAKGERVQVAVAPEERPDDAVARPREASTMAWTDAAWKRIGRVPAGFMRDMTRDKVEQFALAKASPGSADGARVIEVNLALCEEGIAEGRRMMAEMLGSYGGGGAARDAIRKAAAPSQEPPAPARS